MGQKALVFCHFRFRMISKEMVTHTLAIEDKVVFERSLRTKRPRQATSQAAAYDLFMPQDVTIKPSESKRINLGIRLRMPSTIFGSIVQRSCMMQHLIEVQIGTIDSDYSGDIFVGIRNLDTQNHCFIPKSSSVCGIIFQFKPNIKLVEAKINKDPQTREGRTKQPEIHFFKSVKYTLDEFGSIGPKFEPPVSSAPLDSKEKESLVQLHTEEETPKGAEKSVSDPEKTTASSSSGSEH